MENAFVAKYTITHFGERLARLSEPTNWPTRVQDLNSRGSLDHFFVAGPPNPYFLHVLDARAKILKALLVDR